MRVGVGEAAGGAVGRVWVGRVWAGRMGAQASGRASRRASVVRRLRAGRLGRWGMGIFGGYGAWGDGMKQADCKHGRMAWRDSPNEGLPIVAE